MNNSNATQFKYYMTPYRYFHACVGAADNHNTYAKLSPELHHLELRPDYAPEPGYVKYIK